MPTDLVLELSNDLKEIENAVEHAVQVCNSCREDHKRIRLNLRVALTEALSNAILYGNHLDPRKRVRLEITVQSCSIVARITDEGNGFDPHVLPDPTTPVNVRKTNGRGVFLMRKLLDEVRYNERGNSVTLVLRRSTTPGGMRGAQA